MRLQRAEAGASRLAQSFIHPTFAALSAAGIERAKKLADIPLPEPAQ